MWIPRKMSGSAISRIEALIVAINIPSVVFVNATHLYSSLPRTRPPVLIINVNVNLADRGAEAMAVWTIAAQEGTGGARLAAELGAAAGVSLLDREALAHFVHQIDPNIPEADDLEERLGGRLNMLALSTAITAGSADSSCDKSFRRSDAPSSLRR